MVVRATWQAAAAVLARLAVTVEMLTVLEAL
jgi:hypothetical protein